MTVLEKCFVVQTIWSTYTWINQYDTELPAQRVDQWSVKLRREFIKENKKVSRKERNDAIHQENDQEKNKASRLKTINKS